MYKDIETIDKDVTDILAIRNSIRNILTTRIGSVPGKPSFGSNLYNILFSHMDHLTEAVARNYVEEALREYEGRILVEDIEFTRSEEFNRIIIDISFAFEDPDVGNRTENVSIPFSL